MIIERPEFTVYTNLSRKLEKAPSSLSVPRAKHDEPQCEKGFRGVLSLARVEFGAMLAGFTDAPKPFHYLRHSDFDSKSYLEMLLDGSRTHYWSLVNDTQLKNVLDTTPENPVVLAYSRRLLIARSMLQAATRLGQRHFSNMQMRELSAWKDSMDGIQAVLVAKIEFYLAANPNSGTQNYFQACETLLSAEKRLGGGIRNRK